MASEFIGVIRGAINGTIYAVVNPDDDRELDNPRFLLLQAIPTRVEGKGDDLVVVDGEREPMMMVRIPRDDYMAARSTQDLVKLCMKYGSKA